MSIVARHAAQYDHNQPPRSSPVAEVRPAPGVATQRMIWFSLQNAYIIGRNLPVPDAIRFYLDRGPHHPPRVALSFREYTIHSRWAAALDGLPVRYGGWLLDGWRIELCILP